jgi:hypothetical protein
MREGYDLNMLCRNKLDEMRNQLSFFIERDQNTLTMFKTSQKLIDTLSKAAVRVQIMMLRGSQVGYFYSTSLSWDQIEAKVSELARLNVTLLNFYNRNFSKLEN